MPEQKERYWILEGSVTQTVIVRAKGKTLDEAVAAAESGKFDVEEELKPGDDWSFREDTDVQVSEDGENFDDYDPEEEA